MTQPWVFGVFCVLAGVGACSGDSVEVARGARDEPSLPNQLFTRLSSKETGIRFENRLTETRDLNVFTYRNFYNGGGVGIGDFTGDGLPDVILTSNQQGPRLFLNQGHFRFRDITNESGLSSDRGSWTTGVAIGDEYGVADEGYSTQAVLFDYDHDGDLDLFVIENSPRSVQNVGRNLRGQRSQYGGAKLYRNDGDHFTDVTAQAGIYSPDIAFGLGVVVADVNNDGWPDIYVANDFSERDYLYINNRDGTFSEVLDKEMPVLSYFSMGLDIADLDNHGWLDIYTTDMLPEDELRLKTTSAFDSWEVYQSRVRGGFHHQLMRNMLQRNNGNGTFSDVGQMAGVARTDWSWGALIADLDLDGRKDISRSSPTGRRHGR
jgi:hypothetical protein